MTRRTCTERAKLRADAIIHELSSLVRAHLPALSAQQVAITLWAYAKIGVHPEKELLDDLTARADALLCKCAPRNLSNLVWALARLEHRPGGKRGGVGVGVQKSVGEKEI